MSKIRQTALILSEGITEFFFLNSLKDDYSALRTILVIRLKSSLLMMRWKRN